MAVHRELVFNARKLMTKITCPTIKHALHESRRILKFNLPLTVSWFTFFILRTAYSFFSRFQVRPNRMTTRVFAIIIGIDDYKSGSIWNLHSCVDDAKNIKRWLMDGLDVPKDQICPLLNGRATKQNIEESFMQHLVNNPSIEQGDAILVYFAGHGSNIPAPSDWYQDDSETTTVQVLCPYDHDTKLSQGRISGISDRSLQAMIDELVASKGNNITLLLDCCFSPSQTTTNVLDRRVIRWSPTTKAISTDLYRDLWPTARGKLHFSKLGFFNPDVKSHILLAACVPGENAFEGKEGGRFTADFLHIMPTLPLHRTSYIQLVDYLRKSTGESQRYICLGNHKTRVWFDDVPFPPDNRFSPATLESDARLMRVEIGDIHGIVEGSEVSLHLHNRKHSFNPAIASSVVLEVGPSWCLIRVKSHASEVPKSCWARITRWNNHHPFRVHLKSTLTSFIRMWKLRSKISTEPGMTSSANGLNVLRVKNPHLADISLTMGRHDAKVVQRYPVLLDEEKRAVNIHKNDGAEVIDDAARFNLHLLHKNVESPLHNQIQMELYKLDPSSWTRIGVNNLHNAAASISYTAGAIYQVVLRNNSQTDLWPYLAYMDPNRYSTTLLFHPDTTKEAPLRSCSSLEIGSGKPGSEALSFALPDHNRHDHGYLKLFLSSAPVDMRILEQDPYPHWINHHEFGEIPKTKVNTPIWDTMLACVVFIRYPEGIPKLL